ncbi:glycine cleavage system protein H [Tetragenococcus koreensis]|uniref:Glycine cleavage system H protein n=1 Tax=Tetragenococcus koreensis TaxID=290335 RepID=A0AAN4RL53_9ENTE|nr:glycine cleavage system protein H [Tetragenococcus koreensis]AYW46184.1 glycine cleavage system protein H [Tetragenococcus koreensis]MCF1617252.1 glycine cleavage system protein H [Tetragenococcus koreensis]MCF1622073.1 glycine cleavage system protein H [Tetragenococcus koreensis]MCF1627348.1 glycine cleavage system protein H [Tetragenococcus koreensis]MCF1632318.1 glycine cleavage system protein H [Tetragenococcus koreensis]
MKKQCLKKVDNLWVLHNGKEYVVGLTNEAQDELGKISFASLPKVGQTYKKGDTLIELEAEKAISEFASPLSGIVSSINEKVDENVDVLNDEDELNAWIVSLKDVEQTEFESL